MSDPIQDIARQLCILTPTGDGLLAKIRQTIDLLRDAAAERDALAAELAEIKNSMAYHTSLIGRLEAELDTIKAGAGDAIQVCAVAVMRNDGDGGLEPDWLLEGGTAELQGGMTLAVLGAGDFPGQDGSCELYSAPQPAQDVSGLVSALEHIMAMQTRGFITLGEKASAMANEALAKIAQRGGKA